MYIFWYEFSNNFDAQSNFGLRWSEKKIIYGNSDKNYVKGINRYSFIGFNHKFTTYDYCFFSSNGFHLTGLY